jgi:hypothetical protein
MRKRMNDASCESILVPCRFEGSDDMWAHDSAGRGQISDDTAALMPTKGTIKCVSGGQLAACGNCSLGGFEATPRRLCWTCLRPWWSSFSARFGQGWRAHAAHPRHRGSAWDQALLRCIWTCCERAVRTADNEAAGSARAGVCV